MREAFLPCWGTSRFSQTPSSRHLSPHQQMGLLYLPLRLYSKAPMSAVAAPRSQIAARPGTQSACHHQPCLHRSNSFRIHQHSSKDLVSLQCTLTLATGSGLLCLPTPTEGRSPGWLSKSQLLHARGTEGTMARTTLEEN